MNAPVTPWDNPLSYAPDCFDQLGDGSDYGVTGEWWGSDPDEAYRDAVYAEIEDGLVWLGFGALAALLTVVGLLYFGGAL